MLTKDELERYSRQVVLRGLGKEGQEKLKKTKVFIAGMGGLGSAVAIYLTAAGVGTIRMVDYDVVELSNLSRQILHWHKDIGRSKVDSVEEKLRMLNPRIKIEAVKHHHAEHGGFSQPHITTEATALSELRSERIHPRRRAAWFSADFYKLLVYDGLNMKFTELNVRKDPECKVCAQLVGGKR